MHSPNQTYAGLLPTGVFNQIRSLKSLLHYSFNHFEQVLSEELEEIPPKEKGGSQEAGEDLSRIY